MKWSWSIGRFFGIDTHVHATFVLILAWAAVSSLSSGGTLVAAGVGVAFLLAVFGSVLMHELGHALTARMFGVPTRRITLTPLGGLAELETGDMRPRDELLIALAGPAVSLGLGAVLLFTAGLLGSLSPAGFVGGLAWANLAIGLFNLVPAFPMDGGRVLRAGLAMRMEYFRATGIAAKVGRYAALGLAVAGLFTHPVLLLIAAFVYFAARQEGRRAAWMSQFGGVYPHQHLSPRDHGPRYSQRVSPRRPRRPRPDHRGEVEKVYVYNEYDRKPRAQVRYVVTSHR